MGFMMLKYNVRYQDRFPEIFFTPIARQFSSACNINNQQQWNNVTRLDIFCLLYLLVSVGGIVYQLPEGKLLPSHMEVSLYLR